MSTRRGIRYRAIGSGDTFAAPPAPSTSCPPGFHWEDDEVPIRGISACVPDKVATLRLHGNAAAPAPSPPPVATYTPPATSDAAPAPPSSVVLPSAAVPTCPAPWSLWWLLVAAAAGAGAGIYFAAEEKKKRRPNGRIAA